MRERHRIDAEIEQSATALRGVAQPVRRRERAIDPEVGLNRTDLTDHTVVHEPLEPPDQRIAVHPHGLHQEAVVLLGERDELLGLAQVQRERLLAQHMAPRLQTHPGGDPVRRVRSRDVHDVDILVRRERGPVPVRLRNPEPLGERLRRGVRPRGHGHDLGIRHVHQIRREGRRDPAGRQNPPPHSLAHARHSRPFALPLEVL